MLHYGLHALKSMAGRTDGSTQSKTTCICTVSHTLAWTHICIWSMNEWHTLQNKSYHHTVAMESDRAVISCSPLNSCTFSCRVITQLLQLMSETEEVLITGGEKDTSSEELNKLTNPVWNPVTSSSSALNMNHSTTITHLSHGRESTQPWISPVSKLKH